MAKPIPVEKAVEVINAHGGQVFGNENVVYLMGFSFMLGSLFAILLLLLLDFMRRNTEKRKR